MLHVITENTKGNVQWNSFPFEIKYFEAQLQTTTFPLVCKIIKSYEGKFNFSEIFLYI